MTDIEEDIERVAKSIYETGSEDFDDPSWGDANGTMKNMFRHRAKAALEASHLPEQLATAEEFSVELMDANFILEKEIIEADSKLIKAEERIKSLEFESKFEVDGYKSLLEIEKRHSARLQASLNKREK